MPGLASWFRRRLFGVSPAGTMADRRGFEVTDDVVRERVDSIGNLFLDGYHAALDDPREQPLADALKRVSPADRGFAYEGAGMAMALLDLLTPWRRDRLQRLLDGPGAAHTFMVHAGAGWALARLRRTVTPALERADPLSRWLIADGYGFHEGYFRTRQTIDDGAVPGTITGYARRAFDNGVGRSLWFVAGAEPERIAARVGRFAPERHADLWSGVGLACAYAGGAPTDIVRALDARAADHRPRLAQGAAFAAIVRARAGNPTDHTEFACRILCGRSAAAAASVTGDVLDSLPGPQRNEPVSTAEVPIYERWRAGVLQVLTNGARTQ